MKIVVLNEKRINFDNKIDMNVIGENVTLYAETKEKEIITRTNDADVIVIKEIKMNENIINNLSSSVKLICEAGTGYDNIDIMACKKRGITVCNVPEYASRSVAEYVITFILTLSKKGYIEEIKNKTLGVIGTGKIGGEVIKLANSLGMNIIAYSRKNNLDIDYVSLEELLSKSDYISIHLPLTDETYHLLDENKLKLIKKGACLINTSRGKIIDEKALIKLLDEDRFKGVALDVLEDEPIKKDNPLLNRENVILTPHICWSSIEARKLLVEGVKENIKNYENKTIINKVN